MIKLLLALLTTVIYGYNNGVMMAPPRGWSTWCTNDFCGIPDLCSEYEIIRKANAMKDQKMLEMGYEYIFLDDCWADTERDENGELQPSPKLFPSGMPKLIEYVHHLGFKFGLYTCIGTETCKKGRPGSYGHYEQDANTFAHWGVDMVKADNCHRPATNETQQELFTQFSKALNNTGRPMAFAICNWGEENVSEWGPGISQMYRIQMDHLPLYHWPATAAGVGYGQGVAEIINFWADLKPTQRQGAWADPDFLETLFNPFSKIYSSMNFTNSRTEFTFWASWSAPLLVATDPVMSDEKRTILMNEEVLAIHSDPPYQSSERFYNSPDGTQKWMRNLSNGDVAVILYNSNNLDAITMGLDWSEIGWNNDDIVSVRCLWGKSDLGEFSGAGSFSAGPISVHDVRFLRLKKVQSAKV